MGFFSSILRDVGSGNIPIADAMKKYSESQLTQKRFDVSTERAGDVLTRAGEFEDTSDPVIRRYVDQIKVYDMQRRQALTPEERNEAVAKMTDAMDKLQTSQFIKQASIGQYPEAAGALGLEVRKGEGGLTALTTPGLEGEAVTTGPMSDIRQFLVEYASPEEKKASQELKKAQTTSLGELQKEAMKAEAKLRSAEIMAKSRESVAGKAAGTPKFETSVSGETYLYDPKTQGYYLLGDEGAVPLTLPKQSQLYQKNAFD